MALHQDSREVFEQISDSASFCRWAQKNLSTPGPKASIEKRTFHDLKKETIKKRADEVDRD